MSDDHVGYGKPPRHTRFRPGVSGNPRGRPKRVPDIFDDLRAELVRHLPSERPGGRGLTVQRMIAKVLVGKAATGDLRAIGMLLAVADALSSSDSHNGIIIHDENEELSEFARDVLKIEATEGIDNEKDEFLKRYLT